MPRRQERYEEGNDYKKTLQFNALAQFKCMAEKCPDDCCNGWRVSLDEKTKRLYEEKAPELLDSVVEDDKGPKILTNFNHTACSQFVDKLCAIQKKYGEEYLPDTCAFYPRTVRAVGDTLLVSATMSCPEIARLAIELDNPFDLVEKDLKRMPESIVNFKMDGESKDDVFYVMKRFLKETERKDITAQDVMMNILVASQMLDKFQAEYWRKVVDNVFAMASYAYIKPTEERVSKFQLMKYLAEVKTRRPARWLRLFHDIEGLFRVKLNQDTLEHEVFWDKEKQERYYNNPKSQEKIDHIVKRYIAGEMARNIFPYAGTNGTYAFEKAMVIAVHSVLARLALISILDENGNCPAQEELIRVAQTVARGLNHVAPDLVEFYSGKGLQDLGKLHQMLNLY